MIVESPMSAPDAVDGSSESWGLNSAHFRGTHVPVEEPSTASQADKAASFVVPLEHARTRKVWYLFDLASTGSGRRTNLRRREINFNQGDKWKAAINTYIGTIPPNGDALCIVEQNMSGCPLL